MRDRQTLRLGDERDRLDRRLDALADRLTDADDDAASTDQLRQRASSLETQLNAVLHLIDAHGPDATVKVGGLSAGEYKRVEDRAAALRHQRDEDGPMPGARQMVFAASGLVDAPFVDDPDNFDARLESLAAQPVGVPEWVADRASELTTNDHQDFRSLRERLAET